MSVVGTGQTNLPLTDEQVAQIVAKAAIAIAPAGRKILVIIPDHTRSCPLPLVTRLLHAAIAPSAARLDFMIALGTHPAMTEPMIDKLLGIAPGRRGEVLPGSSVFNHEWQNEAALAKIGTLTRDEIADQMPADCLLFARDIDVTINKRIFDYDHVLICGPVFPHEVVGFSGGAKYFFPGICGQELLNFFHWLGALITCPRIIGTKMTPVRKVLHLAMDMVPVEHSALCMVVAGHDLAGLYHGPTAQSWSAAADLSDKTHITYADAPYESVLSRAPEMYDELWVGAKCMYKMESVVADGGELIIYAPHIREISVVHGRIIREIGYHSLPYFLGQWERFQHYPWGVLAHSTHVRGLGLFAGGIEAPRINVTLATGISAEDCRSVNLGYRDPASIDIAHWQNAEHTGRLYVPKAGEMLYKLRTAPAWQTF